MHNSQSWKNNFYIIHNSKFIQKYFNVEEKELKGYCNYILCPKQEHYCKGAIETDLFYILPSNDINEVNNLILNKIPLYDKKRDTIKIRNREISLTKKNLMAIVNATPDSFFPGSRLDINDLEDKMNFLKKMNIDIVDIGGESTRPGSDPVGPEEEWRRIKPVIEVALQKDLTVSVDTYRPSVASSALELGAHIINDVTGMENEEMAILSKKYESGLVIMHKKGTFKNMQDNPFYDNVVLEILDFFYNRIHIAMKYGIEDNIILDPGIGFGKRIDDNLDIIRYLEEFKIGYPLLIGLSRKGFIGSIMNEKVEERGFSSSIFNTISLINGADIIRVHDVEENLKVIKIINKLNNF